MMISLMQRMRGGRFFHFQTMTAQCFSRHDQMHGVCRCDRHTAPAYGKNHKHHQPDLFDEPYEQKYTLKKCAACLSNKSINAVTQISKFWTRLFFRSPTYYFFHRFRFQLDRKSTRLNSSHVKISYAVFCLKKK